MAAALSGRRLPTGTGFATGTTGVEPQPGEIQGTASGGTRPSDQYRGRQMLLEQEVELARKRYDAALKRWNDLK